MVVATILKGSGGVTPDVSKGFDNNFYVFDCGSVGCMCRGCCIGSYVDYLKLVLKK